MSGLPREAQFFISLLVLVFLVGSVIGMMRHGHWIFFVAFVIFFPGGWPALKNLWHLLWLLLKYLIVTLLSTWS
jgi:hypothetical protein